MDAPHRQACRRHSQVRHLQKSALMPPLGSPASSRKTEGEAPQASGQHPEISRYFAGEMCETLMAVFTAQPWFPAPLLKSRPTPASLVSASVLSPGASGCGAANPQRISNTCMRETIYVSSRCTQAGLSECIRGTHSRKDWGTYRRRSWRRSGSP
jgi:hypothetical protein